MNKADIFIDLSDEIFETSKKEENKILDNELCLEDINKIIEDSIMNNEQIDDYKERITFNDLNKSIEQFEMIENIDN